MDNNTSMILLLTIGFIMLLIYVMVNRKDCYKENFTDEIGADLEAIQTVASMYLDDNLTVGNITSTGTISTDKLAAYTDSGSINIENTINSGKIITSDNIEINGNFITGNQVSIDGNNGIVKLTERSDTIPAYIHLVDQDGNYTISLASRSNTEGNAKSSIAMKNLEGETQIRLYGSGYIEASEDVTSHANM